MRGILILSVAPGKANLTMYRQELALPVIAEELHRPTSSAVFLRSFTLRKKTMYLASPCFLRGA